MDISSPRTPLERAQVWMVENAPFRIMEKLPEKEYSLGNGEKQLLLSPDKAELFVFFDGFWHLKIRIPFEEKKSLSREGESITASGALTEESFSFITEKESGESFFLRRKIYHNPSGEKRKIAVSSEFFYFTEGPVADFGYASCKHITRGRNLEKYRYKEFENPHLSYEANNQLFYTYSGGMYLGTAYVDISGKWLTRPGREEEHSQLTHAFLLPEELELSPGETKEYSFLLFAGVGKEEHGGILSDILWRLNDAEMHLPQTDMRNFLANYFSVWKMAELDGLRPHDHYAAHFFAGFYGQFPEGYYPPDQFGCSWLSYDLLKADYFCRLYERTGKEEYKKQAGDIVHFYCCNHFIGDTHLTWPFHTGDFMKAVPPYCKRSGWGAPLDPGFLDSLAQSEMVFGALKIYERYPEFFPEDYGKKLAPSILKMQQKDGHYRRRYNERLEAVEKPGWIDQNYESQSWIPALLLLSGLGGGKECLSAAIRCGEAALADLEIKGLFAMGGGETDYPTLWDVDGYRSMLRAMLALYDSTGEKRFLEGAEKVQLLSNMMMCSYNVEIPENTFYRSINWKCKGMVATSFYDFPDYLRSFATPTGNQSVVWVAYLLLKLYKATGKTIYAQRGIAAARQVMVYRNEESLKGKPYLKNLLYTIFENNPQMSDPGGGYKAGVAQDGYSMFIDLYIFLDDILEEFGDVYYNKDKGELLGINCFKVLSFDGNSKALLENELDFEREMILLTSSGEKIKRKAPPAGTPFEIIW